MKKKRTKALRTSPSVCRDGILYHKYQMIGRSILEIRDIAAVAAKTWLQSPGRQKSSCSIKRQMASHLLATVTAQMGSRMFVRAQDWNGRISPFDLLVVGGR